jgi:hypothetical protein
VDLSGRNAYDLLYLQRMYQAGAGACFDVLSVQGYGLWSGPTDQRLRQTTINFQLHLWLRDMMVKNGDANKPIWISEAGWNPVPNDPSIVEVDRYGRVTMAQAAEWAPLAYERALEEWPWIGVISWWYFKPADDHDRGDSSYYFRLVEPDFTPTPVYEALKAYLTGDLPKVLGSGWHGIQNRGLIGADSEGRTTRTYRVRGTAVYLCAEHPPAPAPVSVTVDGRPSTLTVDQDAACVPLATSLDSGTHTITLAADDWTGLDGLAVIDDTARHRLPWLLVGGLAALAVIVVLGAAVRARWSQNPA